MQALFLLLAFLLPPEAGAAKNESQVDPRCEANLPAHLVYLYSTWDNMHGGWLGKNGSEGAGVRYSEGDAAETHGHEHLQGHLFYNSNLQICVGDRRKTKSAYEEDSGGPLECAGVAYGIVSYGYIDAKPPNLFTRISPYVPWINNILKNI